ncbi:MAG TPA: Uma2 family endonuclease [Caulifigura sp.]|nr:Uma2 family endonuclease [Caulifigura sp.]
MATALTPPASPPQGVNSDCLETDSGLFELIQGVIVEKELSAFTTWLAHELGVLLTNWVKANQLGWVIEEMIFVLDDDRLNQPRPDVAFVSANRWPLDRLPPYYGYWRLAPNLAVEVVSPTDRFEDVVEKAEMYLSSGVEEVWLVVPRTRTIMVYRAGNQMTAVRAGETLETPLLPGWSLDVGTLIPVVPADSAATPN